jgi:hypothetical protein
MQTLLNRLHEAGIDLRLMDLPDAFSWSVVDGVDTAPSEVVAAAERLGLSVDRPGPLRVIVSDGVNSLRLAFEPKVDELAAAAVAAALILDGVVTAPDGVVSDPELIDRILDAGWQVPAQAGPLAATATRLLLDRVPAGAARWELELAFAAEPSVLDLARRVDSIER